MQGDWNAKVGKDAYKNWQGICIPFCHDDTNEKGLRLLEFAIFNDIVLTNFLVITKYPEDGPGLAQMDNSTTRMITF